MLQIAIRLGKFHLAAGALSRSPLISDENWEAFTLDDDKRALLTFKRMQPQESEWGSELPSLVEARKEHKKDEFCIAVRALMESGRRSEKYSMALRRAEDFILNETEAPWTAQAISIWRSQTDFAQVIIPQALSKIILREMHSARETSHQGVMRARLRDHAHWPGAKKIFASLYRLAPHA
eukprot:Plantae.Rhodophyta-Hildenbrandia_rubra.ctg14980.p1 GENE.Plantae.Rhodophyta-Hildenbrandia_rubra.ctg14980~~Plantae.Rhodophyta-Hildenbrandia_rubra.ctg14980.p1  ORF type:complete len:180 (+),score=15.61 Plantae.Rhodophyta-Hildenbrandia_rubra.ctg14980:2425-2964(+)